MKKIVLTLFSLVAILSSASFAQTPAEKTALERFGKDVEAMKAWAKEKEKGFAGNPLAPLYAMSDMTAKCKEINADGLPADLKEAWIASIGSFEKMTALVKELPADPAELQKKMQDPEFQKDFGSRMNAVQQELMPNMKKVEEVAKKYGLDTFGKK